MKNKKTYTILIALCIIGFWVFENFYTPKIQDDSDAQGEIHRIASRLLPELNSNKVVKHKYYILSYSEPHEQAEWVAYQLRKNHLTYDNRRRPYFIEDPKVKSKSADWRNYKRSGFDRGHLCPAGDRRFSEFAYNETFYTSNISPQRKDFNAGVWNRLEQQVRQWCKRYGDLYVITGGVLEEGLEEIGDEDVDVPNSFFKLVFRKENEKIRALAFLIPHAETQEPLQNFLVPIDELEHISKLNFFYEMEADKQHQIESSKEPGYWKF